MGQPDEDVTEDVVRMLASIGIHVTEEDKARARARLAEADARRTLELEGHADRCAR